MSLMEILRIEDLKKIYNQQFRSELLEIPVIQGVSFQVESGEFLGIMGKSGCGKTTLLRMLGLIDYPTSGKIYFDEQDTEKITGNDRADIRRTRIGFIFQDYQLLSSLRVRDNIALPLILGKKKYKEIDPEVEQLADHFQISDLLNKYPDELSGGEKQRAAICRALLGHPDIILADEPTGSLDSQSGKKVIDSLCKINETLKTTIIMVTHDAWMASHCSRVMYLKDGRILGQDIRDNHENQNVYYHEILDSAMNL
jgi:ABC-type lipoprotein export system ATPase subunit